MLASGRHCIRMGDVGLPTAAWSMALRARPGSWRCCELDFDTRAHTRARTHARTHTRAVASKQRGIEEPIGAQKGPKSPMLIFSIFVVWGFGGRGFCRMLVHMQRTFIFGPEKKSSCTYSLRTESVRYISRTGGGLRGASPTWFNSLPRSVQGSPGKVESARIGSAESGSG